MIEGQRNDLLNRSMDDPKINPEKKAWSFTEHKARQVAAATSHYIPCMFIPAASSKLMLYFHGNAEDLAIAEH